MFASLLIHIDIELELQVSILRRYIEIIGIQGPMYRVLYVHRLAQYCLY